jgi:hypothetical protein
MPGLQRRVDARVHAVPATSSGTAPPARVVSLAGSVIGRSSVKGSLTVRRLGVVVEDEIAMPITGVKSDRGTAERSHRLAVEARVLAITGLTYPIAYDFSDDNKWIALALSLLAGGIACVQSRGDHR